MAAAILAILDGQVYVDNDSGEQDMLLLEHRVVLATNSPGAAGTNFFLADICDFTSAPTPKVVFTGNQMVRFIQDQVLFLRLSVVRQGLTEEMCHEATLRYLAYSRNLTPGVPFLVNIHVNYYDVVITESSCSRE